MTLGGLFPDTPQAYGARRNVTDGFAAPGGALERMFENDGHLRELWIQSSQGKGTFKKLELVVGWYESVTAPKALVAQDNSTSMETKGF